MIGTKALDNFERSRYHRRIEKLLDDLSISYLSEEGFPPYRVDILVPSVWAAIEIDGPFHMAKHDRVRDQYLFEHYKLPVLRLKTTKSLWRRKYLEDSINQFIEKHREDAPERKASWLTRL